MENENTMLPVAQVLPELIAELEKRGAAVLSAPPGAGKTTLVPPALLGTPGRILLLEPRRVAARAAAARMASMLGEKVGESVGYRVRGDVKVSARTRIEVVTEGMAVNLMQHDPELRDVGTVIFDEFHERNLPGDLALALACDIRDNLRGDLRLLVMSATLDCERVSALLGGAPVVKSEGRTFPVEVHWGNGFPEGRDIASRTAAMVRRIVECEHGSLLVFLPGAREIAEVAALLSDLASPGLTVAPLYGALDKFEQDCAIAPPPPGVRKVVLATNIAESSLTIEGVRVVVDTGLERKMRFLPDCGISRLELGRISRASATQRAGRAGRLEPGAVYRLWSELDHRTLFESARPEIVEADLAPLVLELTAWGAAPDRLRWLNPVPEAAWANGVELLRELEILDENRRLTQLGRKAAKLNIHPRLGVMMIEGAKLGYAPLAAELAALVEERDILPRAPGTDIEWRLTEWRRKSRDYFQHNAIRDSLLRHFGEAFRVQETSLAGVLLGFAYPDRIGRTRSRLGVHYLLAGGKGVELRPEDDLCGSEFLVAPALNGNRVQLAAPLEPGDIRRYFGTRVKESDRIFFDRERERVAAVRETRLGSLVLKSAPVESPEPGECARILAEAVRATGLHVLELGEAAENFRRRLRFAAAVSGGGWPDWSDEGLISSLETLLARHPEARSFADLRRLPWANLVRESLDYQQRSRLDREFPERFEAPTGSMIKIDYRSDVPVLAIRVQELYGQKIHPVLGAGKLPLKLELLSPARRPIQITSDLPRFWRENWQIVRKEMRAAYPKHVWPEDPANTAPTTRAKPRS